MPNRTAGLLLALLVVGGIGLHPTAVAAVGFQDVSPAGVERLDPPPSDDPPALIPLPTAANRSQAAARDRVRVTTVLPNLWSEVLSGYQPYWNQVTTVQGFGIGRWDSYFATAALVPALPPHPFFGPWGMLAYEDPWLFDRYHAVWAAAQPAGHAADAARWLRLGDLALASGRAGDAVTAYRRSTQAAPLLPLGYLGLGAALAADGDDESAARAFRQGFDRYPAWIAPEVDWRALFAGQGRLAQVQGAAVGRARRGGDASRFVAGVLLLFGDRVDAGRDLLVSLPGDLHAERLLARGPR